MLSLGQGVCHTKTRRETVNHLPGLLSQPLRIVSNVEKKTIYRRSDNGQITTQKYADKHPRTTEKQHVYVPAPKTPKK
jgi:hypothetical protein